MAQPMPAASAVLACRSGAASLGRRVAPEVAEDPAQVADLVAQPRGVLEPQVLGGRQHLLLELDDRLLDLLARHPLGPGLRAPRAAAPAGRRLALGLQELGDVADALDDRGRGDA